MPVVGAVFAGLRLEGVLLGHVRGDGTNATRNLTRLITGSKFARQLQLVLLQGIALAGFNVVDITALYRSLDVPVLVVVRRRPGWTGCAGRSWRGWPAAPESGS